MTEARELTREQIVTALAEAQGWSIMNSIGRTDVEDDDVLFYEKPERAGIRFTKGSFNPLTNNDQFLELTLDPEIHAGMIDVLDEWLSYNPDISTGGDNLAWDWQHSQKYLQDIRLWQLRACVEFLRRRGK